MRFTDILGLAVAALWRQKARTLLTTLGVVFGSFVLAASLSIGNGVQQTIERVSRRSTHLREVRVYPEWGGRSADVPTEAIHVEGKMSDTRRQRLRQALVERRQSYARKPKVSLTRDLLRTLGTLKHVERVVPNSRLGGWAGMGDHTQAISIVSTAADNTALSKRLVAGKFFETPKEGSALVSELLLYHLGLTDDTEMNGAVGKKLRLEVRAENHESGVGIYLLKPDNADLTREEVSGLDKIKAQLPDLLDKFNLAPGEKDALREALRVVPPKASERYSQDFTIQGVFPMPGADDPELLWQRIGGDVILPVETAEDLFFRSSSQTERAVPDATLLVDQGQNVKEVIDRVRELGLDGYAPLEHIERERLMYLLIFGAMTCVAAVALVVAALGIANTMLMSVLERTREVGIMKAVGAGNGHIQLIFLVEGAIIGLLGGGLGLLLGWLASYPGDNWVRSMVQRDLKIELKEALFVFPPLLLVMVMFFAMLVTTLAAVYPARRAAKVDPVTALRHE